jgi:streptogramin lyase
VEKEIPMKRAIRVAAATATVAAGLIGAVAAPAFAAQPTTPRQDDYTQSFCTIEGVGTFPGERYDVNAIGGHETAVSHFNLHHPGIICQVGP